MQNQQDIETTIDIALKTIELAKERAKISLEDISAAIPHQSDFNNSPIEQLESSSFAIDSIKESQNIQKDLNLLNTQLKEVQTKLSQLRKENTQLAANNSLLNEQNQRLSKDINRYISIANELDNIEKILDKEIIARQEYETNLQKSQNSEISLREKVRDLTASQKVLKRILKDHKKVGSKLLDRMEKKDRKLKETKALLKESKTENLKSEKALTKSEKKIEKTLLNSERALAQNQKETRDLNRKNSDLKEEFRKSKVQAKELSTLKKKYETLEDESLKLEEHNSNLRIDIKHLKDNSTHLKYANELTSVYLSFLSEGQLIPITDSTVRLKVQANSLQLSFELYKEKSISKKSFNRIFEIFSKEEIISIMKELSDIPIGRGRKPKRIKDLIEIAEKDHKYTQIVEEAQNQGINIENELVKNLILKLSN